MLSRLAKVIHWSKWSSWKSGAIRFASACSRPKTYPFIGLNCVRTDSPGDDKPAERPYIVTMPTIYGGEGIDQYSSWVIGMANLLDCELIFFFCGIRVDVKPGASVEDCFGQWLRVFKEIDG